MQRSAISHARLMRESIGRVERALRSEDRKEHLVAQRIMENTSTWQSWEREHSFLMRQVADTGALRFQAATLRKTALRLIHAKALFEYLRKSPGRGPGRAQVLNHFYPSRGYQHAVVTEHAAYLRKACSFLCTSHVGSDLVQDPTFLDPMQQYETLYAEYFDLYCDSLFPNKTQSASAGSLLPLLKHQLGEWRWLILNPREGLPRLTRESEIRRPSGDTQRMPVFKPKT